jgi:integrase/recombinase XerD
MPEVFSVSEQNKKENISKENETTSLQNLHELFIRFKFHGALVSKQSIRNYRHNFELLLKFRPYLKLEDLTEETLINFFAYLNTRERVVGQQLLIRSYKNSSLAIVRSSLNCFFEWLIERDFLVQNPFKKIPYPKVAYTDSRAFTPKEFDTICSAVNTKIQWASLLVKKRNIALIMFLIFTGVRKEELLGLELSDLDFDTKLIKIRAETSKSKKSRIIPMNHELISYLEDYLIFRKEYTCKSLWISTTLDRPFTQHGAKHLIELISKETKVNCHLHRFRHTFATNYYKRTHDLVGLKSLMGHSSLKMTLTYLRSLPDSHVVEQIQRMTLKEFL